MVEAAGNDRGGTLIWRSHLYRRSPGKRYAVLLIALAVGLAGAEFVSPLLGAFAFAIILGATAEYWLGTVYRIDETGASAKTGVSVSKIEWANVRRVVISDDGVKVSPLGQESRLSAFRGVFLRFGDVPRADVIDQVRHFCNDDVRTVERRTDRAGGGGSDFDHGSKDS